MLYRIPYPMRTLPLHWRKYMKIRIEFDEQLQEEEIIIRCSSLTEKIQKIQKIFEAGCGGACL